MNSTNSIAPGDIERESMRIIDGLLPAGLGFDEAELQVVKRLVHTCGDPALAHFAQFSPGAVAKGVAALRGGCLVVTDTQMVMAGVNRGRIEVFGGRLVCRINDDATRQEADLANSTRASAAMRTLGAELGGAVIAIGNAPTALRQVLTLVREGADAPALVVGMPVGFVDAAESKEALAASDIPYITIRGTRGGSPLAAAAVNALLRL